MNRGFLKFAAVVLGSALIVIPFLGLDGLPRDVRRQIGAERTTLAAAQQHLKTAQQQVAHDLAAEPDLFRGIPESQAWQGELAADAAGLQTAARGMEQLNALEKQNRRGDRDKALALLVQERGERESAVNQAAGIEQAADHWVELKQHLPETLARMDRDYRMIQSFDSAPLAAEVQKAEAAWPDKRSDLESRFDSEIRRRQQQDEQLWQSTAQARQQAAGGHLPAAEIGKLVEAADKIHADSALLPQKRAEIEGLAAQLNTTWDKVLVDMDKHGHTWREDIRTISTPQGGQTTSSEQWVEVSEAQYNGVKNDLGMAIQHKPAGKYDFEADRVAQPAGFAYMAPPGQTNQYGYWEHRDGRDFWVFYGQYALMRDLLFNYHYSPLPRYDWEEYRDYRSRGQTYYGRDEANSTPKYGSQGSSTIDRYGGSNYARSGGFRNSPYASKSGSFRDSQFATPGGSSTPKRFGSRTSRPEEPGFTFHSNPRPRPSFRMPSTGRRFGRH